MVAFDSSSYSYRAFDAAIDVAEAKSKITVTTVLTGIYQPSIGFSMKYNKEELAKYTKVNGVYDIPSLFKK